MLALLLGGEGGAEDQAFPATLQALLGGVGVTGEALEVEGVTGGEGDATDDDESGPSLDVALAALAVALGLGGVTPPLPPAAEASDAIAVLDGGAGKMIEGLASGTVADGAGGGGDPTATSAKIAVDGAVATSGVVVAPASDVATVTAIAATAVTPTTLRATQAASGEDGRPVPQASVVSPGSEAQPIAATGAGTLAEVGAAGRPTPSGVQGGSTDRAHPGYVDAANAVKTTAFSSGGSDQQPLDLGTPQRSQAFVVAGKPATTITTATVSGYEGEQLPTTTTATGASTGDTPTALPPLTTTTSPQSGVLSRAETAVQHPSGIDARWGERVVDALRLSAMRGGGEIRLQLEPEGLGHIDVRLNFHADGVRAVIVAEHESTRALLTSQQHVLQDAFNRSDLRLSGFSVDVGSGGGAATFGRDGEAGEGGGTHPSATVAAASEASTEALELNAAPLANGRVNVRV